MTVETRTDPRFNQQNEDEREVLKELGQRGRSGKRLGKKRKGGRRRLAEPAPPAGSNTCNSGFGVCYPEWSTRVYWKGVTQNELCHLHRDLSHTGLALVKELDSDGTVSSNELRSDSHDESSAGEDSAGTSPPMSFDLGSVIQQKLHDHHERKVEVALQAALQEWEVIADSDDDGSEDEEYVLL